MAEILVHYKYCCIPIHRDRGLAVRKLTERTNILLRFNLSHRYYQVLLLVGNLVENIGYSAPA